MSLKRSGLGAIENLLRKRELRVECRRKIRGTIHFSRDQGETPIDASAKKDVRFTGLEQFRVRRSLLHEALLYRRIFESTEQHSCERSTVSDLT